MMISTKGRYALRVMVDLAMHHSDDFVSLKDISQRQDISTKYLEAIVSKLCKANLLESARGKTGGYRLNKPAKDYTIAEILVATESTIAPVACVECNEQCQREADCLTRPMWDELNDLIQNFLQSKTLQELID